MQQPTINEQLAREVMQLYFLIALAIGLAALAALLAAAA
jgi:hypothetical protein